MFVKRPILLSNLGNYSLILSFLTDRQIPTLPELVLHVISPLLRSRSLEVKAFSPRRTIPIKKIRKCNEIVEREGLLIVANDVNFIVSIPGEKYPGNFNSQSHTCTCLEFAKWTYCKHMIVLNIKNKITLFDCKDLRRFKRKKAKGRPKKAKQALAKQ